jgi:hypothetical protein
MPTRFRPRSPISRTACAAGLRLVAFLSFAALPPLAQSSGSAASEFSAQRGAQPCGIGRWEPPYDHEVHGFHTQPLGSPIGGQFNAVHLSLIPSGPHRGKVLAWDRAADTAASAKQRWSIIDPNPVGAAVFKNFELVMPNHQGDLFCSGHTWMSNGDLFVAGGTTLYPTPVDAARDLDASFGFVGGKLAYVYDCDAGPNGAWLRQADLAETRWYPTVVHAGTDELLVLGGVGDTAGHPKNSYEVFDPQLLAWKSYAGTTLVPGPRAPEAMLTYYPRAHWLSDGTLFTAGQQACSARLDHASAPGVWQTMRCAMPWYLDYNATILQPNDTVLRIGGELELEGDPEGYLSMTQSCPATATGAAWEWSYGETLQKPRSQFNAVLLPDGGVLVIGGIRNAPGHLVERITLPELLPAPDGPWLPMAEAPSARPYHSTALLLPNGKVLSAGGDEREYDYQVYVPAYLECGAPRPLIANAPALIEYARPGAPPHVLSLESGAAAPVAELVLMAPGSVTHHSDSNQRRIVLPIAASGTSSVEFHGPQSPHHAPPGLYMLFALSDLGVPSQATWVRLQ